MIHVCVWLDSPGEWKMISLFSVCFCWVCRWNHNWSLRWNINQTVNVIEIFKLYEFPIPFLTMFVSLWLPRSDLPHCDLPILFLTMFSAFWFPHSDLPHCDLPIPFLTMFHAFWLPHSDLPHYDLPIPLLTMFVAFWLPHSNFPLCDLRIPFLIMVAPFWIPIPICHFPICPFCLINSQCTNWLKTYMYWVVFHLVCKVSFQLYAFHFLFDSPSIIT